MLQVFIRTVVVNAESEAERATSRASLVPTVMHGTIKMNADAVIGADNSRQEETNGDYKFIEPTNPCGCVRATVWKFTIPATLLFLLFEGLFIGLKASILVAFSTISLIIACVGCNLLCCPCCQPAKGADE